MQRENSESSSKPTIIHTTQQIVPSVVTGASRRCLAEVSSMWGCDAGGRTTKALNVLSVCARLGKGEKGSGDAGERWGYCAAPGRHADQPSDITGGGVCMRAHVCVCSWGVMNADSWACRFNSLLYMLERTHTMQNAGSTVAVIAIVHAVCVSASVCAHAACKFKSVCACVWKLHTSTQKVYNKWFDFFYLISILKG